MAGWHALRPCEVRVYEAEDPEIPADRYHVFEVRADAPLDDAMRVA